MVRGPGRRKAAHSGWEGSREQREDRGGVHLPGCPSYHLLWQALSSSSACSYSTSVAQLPFKCLTCEYMRLMGDLDVNHNSLGEYGRQQSLKTAGLNSSDHFTAMTGWSMDLWSHLHWDPRSELGQGSAKVPSLTYRSAWDNWLLCRMPFVLCMTPGTIFVTLNVWGRCFPWKAAVFVHTAELLNKPTSRLPLPC